MAGWYVSTIVLDTCWTVWTLVALLLLRRPIWPPSRLRWILLLGFGVLALVLELTTGLSWHEYLMAWLGAHVVLAAVIAVALVSERRLQAIAGLVSLAGLTLLWVQSGAGDWQYVTWSVACVVCLGAGFGLCWATVLRTEQRKTTMLNDRLRQANDTCQQQSQRAQTAEWQHHQAARDHSAAEDKLTSLRAAYDRVHQEARELKAQRDRASRQLNELRSARRESPRPAVRPGGEDDDAPEASAVTLRFFLVPEPEPSQAAAPEARRFRLGIERTVVSVPAGRLDSVSTLPAPPSPGEQRAASPEGPLSRITSAAAASLATELTKPLAPGDRWLSTHSYLAPEIADALHQIPGGLHELVANPARHVAPHIGLPAPAGLAIGTVAAQAAFRSITAPMAQVARCCEIAGVVAGVATGVHPLAAICVKMLAHDEISRVLTRDLTELIKEPDWKIDSPPAPEPPKPPEPPKIEPPKIEEPPAPEIEPPAPSPGGFGRFW